MAMDELHSRSYCIQGERVRAVCHWDEPVCRMESLKRMKERLTKKEELRLLRKLLTFLHGENRHWTIYVMEKVVFIKDFDCLDDLVNKYKQIGKPNESP